MSKILIVDDRPVNRELLMAALGHQEHTFPEASDGAKVLEIAREAHPDLAITDILMPTMDGYEFVRQLRADPVIAHTPVIFHTAHYLDREARTLAEKSGVLHVLPKPFERNQIAAMVRDALNQSWRTSGKTPAREFDKEHVVLSPWAFSPPTVMKTRAGVEGVRPRGLDGLVD